MYVSTLRGIVEAMGGELDIIARFPGGQLVYLKQFKRMRGKTASKPRKQSKTHT
jgi:hypothetical protein